MFTTDRTQILAVALWYCVGCPPGSNPGRNLGQSTSLRREATPRPDSYTIVKTLQSHYRDCADRLKEIVVCQLPVHEAVNINFSEELVPFGPYPAQHARCRQASNYPNLVTNLTSETHAVSSVAVLEMLSIAAVMILEPGKPSTVRARDPVKAREVVHG